MKVVILIPTYNERENISLLFQKIKEVVPKLSGFKTKILVVDDNSEDKTAKLVKDWAKNDTAIQLLLRKKKEGLGAAYLAGLTHAFEKMKADVVLVMDADLSHDPKYFANFLKKIKGDADVVIGSRYIKGGSIAEAWAPHRKFLSIFGNRMVSFIIGEKGLSDWTSGFRAIRREVFEAVYPQLSGNRQLRGYTFNIALAYFSKERGFRICEIPIRFQDRRAGKSKLGFEYLFHTPLFVLKTRLKSVFGGIVKI